MTPLHSTLRRPELRHPPDDGGAALGLSLALVLRQAIEERRCLVCLYQETELARARRWFLNESYSEAPVIVRMVAAQGLCLNHTRWLLVPEAQWQMGFIAEILTGRNQRLAGEMLRRAERRAHRRGLAALLTVPSDLGAAFVPRAECLFCDRLRTWEDWALQGLAGAAGAAPVREAGMTTCATHLFMLAPLVSESIWPCLAESLAARLASLLGNADKEPATASMLLLGRYPRADRSALLPTIESEFAGGGPASTDHAAPDAARGELEVRPLDVAGCPLCCAAAVGAEPASWPPVPPQQLCRAHTAGLLAGPSSPAVVRQLGDWARRAIVARRDQPPRRARVRPAGGATCPVCRQRSQRIAGALTVLEQTGADELGRVWFCLPHLPLVLRRVTRDRAVAVLAAEQALLGRLHHELGEFFRKSEHRFRHESKGAEQTAWVRAADVLAGSYPADDGYEGELQRMMRKQAWTQPE